MKYSEKTKKKITEISKEFASGFKENIESINGSGWLIVDPLSAFLSFSGYKNKLSQYTTTDDHVLIIDFESGDRFIPAGGDLKHMNENFKNWMWL